MFDHHSKLMRIAYSHATVSDDPSTKVGAVITLGDRILSFGHNHVVRRIPHTDAQIQNREWKYPRVIHAEVDAILNWRDQIGNCHMYITHHPCDHCAALIIESGITEVFTRPVSLEMAERWPGMKIAADMFKEAGVPVTFLDT